MKNSKLFSLIAFIMLLVSSVTFAQNAPIDFEADGNGADWTLSVFENDTNPAVEIIDNPDASGINTSSKVAKFTALQTGQPWAGCESLHGSDIGTFNLDETNCTVKIMVWKSVISDFGIKFSKPDGWSMGEIKVANTVVDQWEELTFDFSSQIESGYDQIVIFPDFNLDGRTQDNVIYFDNITFSEKIQGSDGPTVAAPIPTHDAANVVSVFSDSYTNLDGTDFNPGWGQSTVVTTETIESNNMLKYATFNYQGTQLAAAQDVSIMEYLHVDVWTEDATVVLFTPISQATGEFGYSLTPIVAGEWNSYDIPLSAFEGVSMADIHQFKFDGQAGVSPSTIYIDNLFFYKSASVADATLSDLKIDGETVADFSASTLNYNIELPYGTTLVPTVTATANDTEAQVVITDATELPGTTSVLVTASDNETTLTYNVNFTLEYGVPTIAAPTPTIAENKVISLFSNAYTNVTVDTWSADWDQADLSEIQIEGNDTKLYENMTFAGIEFKSETIDATNMTHFHLDFWTPVQVAGKVFKIKLVDFGADGVWGNDDVEHELILDESVLSSENWISLDLALEDFTGLTTKGHMAQIVISGDFDTVYLDNLYFWKDGVGINDNILVTKSELSQNYPNPFNPVTTFNYSLAKDGFVSLKVYDIAGRLVKTLVNDNKKSSNYKVSWNATNNMNSKVASGVYFYKLRVDNRVVDTKSMILMK